MIAFLTKKYEPNSEPDRKLGALPPEQGWLQHHVCGSIRCEPMRLTQHMRLQALPPERFTSPRWTCRVQIDLNGLDDVLELWGLGFSARQRHWLSAGPHCAEAHPAPVGSIVFRQNSRENGNPVQRHEISGAGLANLDISAVLPCTQAHGAGGVAGGTSGTLQTCFVILRT